MQVHLEGDSYCEYITIQDLPTFTNYKAQPTNNESYACYELDFGYCYPNTMAKKAFKISNNSVDATYKFQFSHNNNLIFIPSIGHLHPGTFKDIYATFLTKEPLNIVKVTLLCIKIIDNYFD